MSLMNWIMITDNHIPGIEKERYLVSRTGQVWDMKRQIFLPFEVTRGGYLRVNLHLQDGGMIRKSIHQLVMIVQKGYDPDPEKNTVDHLNGDKSNNYTFNLEWVTSQENTLRAIKNNQYPQFELVLQEEDVPIICQMLKEGKNYMEISNYFLPKYGRPINRLVMRIYRGDAWKHISKDYMPFPKIQPSYIKLTPEIVEVICQMLSQGIQQVEITRYIFENYKELNMDFVRLQKVVSDIYNRIRCVNISSKYIF